MSAPRRQHRVAVVGAGPSGIFATQALIGREDVDVSVDVFDRLPSPFGLVRYGVAPDHTSIKSVTRSFEKVFESDRVTFFGLVELGRDVHADELRAGYDAVVYAAGASEDARLGIPGEDLPGSRSAREFVAWYSGHPDATPQPLEGARRVVAFGVGNVAVDVARILLADHEHLSATDMPQQVLDELRSCRVDEVTVVGRRGPQHASFTTTELRELLALPGVRVTVDADLAIDPDGLDRRTLGNLEALRAAAARPVEDARAHLRLVFWHRPMALVGAGHVEAVDLERTAPDAEGRVHGTGEVTRIPADLALRAIGYRGRPLPEVPFDAGRGVIPNVEGRVTDLDGTVQAGEYVVGWIKRGPVGVIGTNKSDAVETVRHLLDDLVTAPPSETLLDVPALLAERGVRASTFSDWKRIDASEVALGGTRGRARTKLETWQELIDVAHSGRPGGPWVEPDPR